MIRLSDSVIITAIYLVTESYFGTAKTKLLVFFTGVKNTGVKIFYPVKQGRRFKLVYRQCFCKNGQSV